MGAYIIMYAYKFRCNQVHPLYGALATANVPVRVTRVRLQYSYGSSCRTLQYRDTIMLLSVSRWYDLGAPVFDGAEQAGFNSSVNAILLT